jgi:hypothetical protein
VTSLAHLAPILLNIQQQLAIANEIALEVAYAENKIDIVTYKDLSGRIRKHRR